MRAGFRQLQNDFKFLDGGMGHFLQKSGVPFNKEIWSLAAMTNPQYHQNVINAHKQFLYAGCNIITTNSYCCTPLYLSKIHKEQEMESFIQLSVDLANTAIEQYSKENVESMNQNELLIAAGIPPMMDSYNPNTVLPESKSIYFNNRIINAFKQCSNVNLFLIETMSSYDHEAKYVLNAMICNGLTNNYDGNDRDIYLFFALREDGLLRDGNDFNDVVIKLQKDQYLETLPIKFIGVNCCKPEAFDILMNNLTEQTLKLLDANDIFIGCYPNQFVDIKQGRVLDTDGGIELRKDLSSQLLYQKFFKSWIEKYCNDQYRLRLIGGCCGVTPKDMEYAITQMYQDFVYKKDELTA